MPRTGGEFFIVNDSNPLLDMEEINASVVLSGNLMFGLHFDEKDAWSEPIVHSSDLQVSAGLSSFFAAIRQLPEDYLLSNARALDFLDQRFEMD